MVFTSRTMEYPLFLYWWITVTYPLLCCSPLWYCLFPRKRTTSGFPDIAPFFCSPDYLFSQVWFPTVQLVLHADWQDVWHSPQPPFFMESWSFLVFKDLICFILAASFAYMIWSFSYGKQSLPAHIDAFRSPIEKNIRVQYSIIYTVLSIAS